MNQQKSWPSQSTRRPCLWSGDPQRAGGRMESYAATTCTTTRPTARTKWLDRNWCTIRMTGTEMRLSSRTWRLTPSTLCRWQGTHGGGTGNAAGRGRSTPKGQVRVNRSIPECHRSIPKGQVRESIGKLEVWRSWETRQLCIGEVITG